MTAAARAARARRNNTGARSPAFLPPSGPRDDLWTSRTCLGLCSPRHVGRPSPAPMSTSRCTGWALLLTARFGAGFAFPARHSCCAAGRFGMWASASISKRTVVRCVPNVPQRHLRRSLSGTLGWRSLHEICNGVLTKSNTRLVQSGGTGRRGDGVNMVNYYDEIGGEPARERRSHRSSTAKVLD